MIGGSTGVNRRELKDPPSRTSSVINNTNANNDSNSIVAPSESTQHPHASSRPIPAEQNTSNDSRRQLDFSPSDISSSTNQRYLTSSTLAPRPTTTTSTLAPSVASTSMMMKSPEPFHPNSSFLKGSSSSNKNINNENSIQKEVDLLWKALHEERHIVKMKSEVIGNLEGKLREERSARAGVERERDQLKEVIQDLRSEIQYIRGGADESSNLLGISGADDISPPKGSPPSSSYHLLHSSSSASKNKRPTPLPIGFAPGATTRETPFTTTTGSSSSSVAAAAASLVSSSDYLFSSNSAVGTSSSSKQQQNLAQSYLETELNHASFSKQMLKKSALQVICELETSSRETLNFLAKTEFKLLHDECMKRERSLQVICLEARSRQSIAVESCNKMIDLSVEYGIDKEQTAIKYLKQSFTRLEKELFINMQDLARAAEQTSKHHDQMSKCVENYQEHLQNLHWQCVFELFRGEASVVRWNQALSQSSIQLPKWFESSQELFEEFSKLSTDLFAQSAKQLMMQESQNRGGRLLATSSLLRSSGGGGGGSNNNSNLSTPTAAHHHASSAHSRNFPAVPSSAMNQTPQQQQQQQFFDENNNPEFYQQQQQQQLQQNPHHGGGGDIDDLLERIRHLEGRLAQKTRLIGLHVKRVSELEIENDHFRYNTNGDNNNAGKHHHPRSSTPPPVLSSSAAHNQQQPGNQHRHSFADRFSSRNFPSDNNNQQNYNQNNQNYNNTNTNNNSRRAHSSSLSKRNNDMNNIPLFDPNNMPKEMEVFKLYEEWQRGVVDIVADMRDDLLSAVRPWYRVPRALLAQMQATATARGYQSSSSLLSDDQQQQTATSPTQQLSHSLITGSPKQSKTLYIRGLTKADKQEYQDYETQAMAASLVASPDTVFEQAKQAGLEALATGESGGGVKRNVLMNHFLNYVSMTLLDEAREYSITLLRHLDDMYSAFHRLRPVVRSVDVLKVSLMEGALSLAEAQRDQALTSSHWIHSQAEQAVETLRGLISKSAEVTEEKKEVTSEEAANHARTVAAARRLQEVSSLAEGSPTANAAAAAASGVGGEGATATFHHGSANQPLLQEVSTAFDNIQTQQQSMNDPEQLENQRLAEEFAAKCNLLVNRASFLYKRLIERERDVDVLSRQLAEIEVREGETRDSSDASVVVQILEREIADDAMLMLREAMLEERNYAQATIRKLLDECLERNIAIREYQQLVQNLFMSCRFAVGLAQHSEKSAEFMHDSYYEMGKKLLRFQRGQLLPPISEVALQMYVAHFEFADSLVQSHAAIIDNAQEAEHNVDSLVQRRKIYEKEMVEMGQEMYRLNQENRVARSAVKNMEQWTMSFVTDTCAYIQSQYATTFATLAKDLFGALGHIEKMKTLLPENYMDVSEKLEHELFEKTAFEERAKLLETKLTKATTKALESTQDLNDTRSICEKMDRLRVELESNNRELELLLLQEREAAEHLRERNISITDDLTGVREELTSVKRALITESEAHSATIRNFSSRR